LAREKEKATVAHRGDALAVEIPRRMASLWRAGTELAFIGFGTDGALLLRSANAGPGVLAGTLSTFSVAEAFGWILSGIRTGRLVVTRGGSRRSVSFREGQVVFAHSTEPWERLGSALVKLGLLSQYALEAALKEVEPGTRLGQVLTRQGVLTPAELYTGMTYLVREIVIDLFAETEGEFLYVEGLPASEDQVKLPDATRELALEGFRRAEEFSRLRARLAPELVVAQGPFAPDEGREVWARAGDGAKIEELRPGFEGSEWAFLSLIASLLLSGSLEARIPSKGEARPARADALPLTERYRALVQALCDALLSAGQGLDALRSFLSEPLPGMEEAFAGVELSDEGSLDVEKVLNNVGPAPAARAGAFDALDAFIAYALFSARNVLPQQKSEQLAAELRRAQGETG
jgi:hypothetical protein